MDRKRYILLALVSLGAILYIICDIVSMAPKRRLIPYFTDQLVGNMTIVEQRESDFFEKYYRWWILGYPEKIESQILDLPLYKQDWNSLPLEEAFVDEVIQENFGWAFSGVDICDRYDLLHCSGVWMYHDAIPGQSFIGDGDTMIIINVDKNIIILIKTDP